MIVIFAGPTISHDDVTALIECECLPPVSHGSILKLDLSEVSAIGIIDGYFEGVPSVWHKEILYAMDQGVHVYGASSMGALRAAELHAFGMRGVGQIFDWYRDLVIEDDDEVAVLHGPAEVGYAVASEPMVSIRRTLQLAVAEQVIAQQQHDVLIDAAKSTFYKERSWNGLLADDQWEGLRSWVNKHRVDLKREDAIAMLQQMEAGRVDFARSLKSDFQFEWTNVWDAAYRAVRGDLTSQLGFSDRLVLDQLKLSPDGYQKFEERALLSWLEHHPNRLAPGVGSREALRNFREEHGLMTRAALVNHMQEEGLSEEGLEEQMNRAGLLLGAKELAGDLSEYLVKELHLSDSYQKLLEEGEKKAAVLQQAGASVASPGVLRGHYLVWYFEKILGVGVPLDLERYMEMSGFQDSAEFDRVVIGEYLYQRCLTRE